MPGPLEGLRAVEMVGLGPGPFCGMLLADMGAEVLRVDRVEAARAIDRSKPATSAMDRGKQAVAVDLKQPDGVEALLRLTEQGDAFFEVFRPGVAERLGIGPDVALARNPGLVYGRLTGWGQDGPHAQAAGHDIDYIALAGALEPLGRAGEKPTPPINVLGDFAGGGMLLAFGIACALFERGRTGTGQVIDAAMVDGAALMLTPFYGARASGFWGERGTNHLDTGAPFYEVYETADDKFVAVGTVEPKFYAELMARLGVDADLDSQYDKTRWPDEKKKLAEVFRTKTRDEWCALLEGTDACFAPVLTPLEAPDHPHNRARGTFVELAGVPQPAPAPRFSRSAAPTPTPAMHPGDDTDAVLAGWGFEASEIERLRNSGAVL
jgi:alpha-methylacyl-CoA racemase